MLDPSDDFWVQLTQTPIELHKIKPASIDKPDQLTGL
jgi:hypothetical protein